MTNFGSREQEAGLKSERREEQLENEELPKETDKPTENHSKFHWGTPCQFVGGGHKNRALNLSEGMKR